MNRPPESVSIVIAVIADGFYSARKGRDALVVDWDESAGHGLSSAKIRAQMRQQLDSGPAKLAREVGQVGAAAHRAHSATYAAPYLAHACMEPMNATADVTQDHCVLYAPTQGPGPHRAIVAGLLGFKPEQVSVVQTFLGGGFGRRFCADFVIAAAEASKAAGAPVKVVYTREDDMRAQYYRPASMVHFTAAVDAHGDPEEFTARVCAASMARATGMGDPNGVDAAAVEGLVNWPYHTPHLKVEWAEHVHGPAIWFWRSVGSSQNVFFAESFVDELAHRAGRDPYEYRRKLLADEPRLLAVLDLAAQKAGWGSALPKGHARGIAVAESFSSYVAEVVEVSLAADGTPLSRDYPMKETPGEETDHKHHRAPGSIGACSTPGRVFKGTKMAGRLGGEQVTTTNLEVVGVDAERQLVLVKGAVPGSRGSVVVLRTSVKNPMKAGGQR